MRTALLVAISLIACGKPSGRGDRGGGGADACSPEGATRCMGASYQTCTDGTWTTSIDCPVQCIDAFGCVQCSPGQDYCTGGAVWTCDATGHQGMQVQACTGDQVCEGGACVDACSRAASDRSSLGCEYLAVDLDRAIEVMDAQSGMLLEPSHGSCSEYGIAGLVAATLPVCTRTQGIRYHAGRCDPPDDACPSGFGCNPAQPACVRDAQHAPFAIAIANPQASPVHVTVTGPGGETIHQTIAAGQVATILPQAGGAIPDESVEYTVLAKKAYKITSDLPVAAYQFNPLDPTNALASDASLLIPRATFDGDYYAMSWPTLDRRAAMPSLQSHFGYLTIVAWSDHTQIAVTPTAAVQASATQATIAAGTTATFTLNAQDVLQLEASGSGDLTGTHVTSPNGMPFGMFGGHEDHLEEMLFPTSTWGKAFAITRSQPRGGEPDHLRILAQQPGTSVTFTPAPSAVDAGNCGALGPGQFCDVEIQGDTELTSSQPVLVGQFLEAPRAMALAVPIEQYRTDYAIVIPDAYQDSYLSISAAPTGGVTVDGAAVTLAPYPGVGTHRAARVPVAAGPHAIHCADGCGVLVYGRSDATSYVFAAGLALQPIAAP